MKNIVVGSVLAIALIVSVILLSINSTPKDVSYGIEPFDHVRWVVQPDGKILAEAYINALDSESRLEGDTAQDVVSLIHKGGKMALSDTVVYTGKDRTNLTNPNGVVAISIYHLLDVHGDREVGYYKRKFARGE